MSAIELMRSIGRPIAYHPALARHVGGVNAAIFLCQLIYWDERADSEELGVYKTAEEWEQETGLSYREQAGARKKLRDLGLITETNQRLQHRIYYKLERQVFDALMRSVTSGSSETREPTKAQFPNDENAIGEQPKAQSGNSAKRSSSNDENAVRYIDRDYTETTTEITTEKKSPAARVKSYSVADLVAFGVDDQVAAEFLAMRKRKGASLTPIALQTIQKEAAKAGWTLDDVLRECIARGWRAFKAEWVADTQRRSSNAERNADWNARMSQAIADAIEPKRQPMKDMGVIDAIG